MFSIDFPEIVIILGLALVVLGPKKLPVAATKIGRWVGRARTMARQFREQLEQEVSSAENAADIRKSIDSVGAPTPKPPAADAAPAPAPAPTTQNHGVPYEGPPRESVPQEAVSHGPSVHEAHQAPFESGPYEMPPPEGYGPAPQQLSFDQQLHDTGLPPEDVPSREWMPETQTWMAGAGWDRPEPVRGEPAAPAQVPAATPRPAGDQRPSPRGDAPDPAVAKPSSRTEAVEHGDR